MPADSVFQPSVTMSNGQSATPSLAIAMLGNAA